MIKFLFLKFCRLYQESEYEKFKRASPPEIQRSDVSLPILQLKALGIDNIVRFNFPSAPPAKNMVAAVELLFALGALDSGGNLTRPLGEQMAELPLHPTFAKMLLVSSEFQCSEEITTIIAMLQIESVFLQPYGQGAQKARMAKRKFEVAEGDLITLLNVYKAFISNNRNKNFCNQNYLSYKRLKRASEMKLQMMKTLKRFQIPIVSSNGKSNHIY